jgi:hypothetical protein
MEKAPDRVSCFLLALPAELRLRIYEACLVSSRALHLTSSTTHRRYSNSGISPALLATCRQIHIEAQGFLYKENAICIVTDAQTKHQPLVAESRCPQRALQKLRRIFLVLDYTIPGRAPFPAPDFDVFTALTSLEQVRFAVVFRENSEAATQYLHMTLPNLLHLIRIRLPARAQICLGVELGSTEEEIVEDFLQRREEILRQEQRQRREENARRQAQLHPSLHREPQPVVLANMTSSELEEMLSDGMNRLSAASPDLKPGLLSGSIPDVFALKRYSVNADVRAVPLESTIRQTGTAAKPDSVPTVGCKELDPGMEARPSRYRRRMRDVLRLFK